MSGTFATHPYYRAVEFDATLRDARVRVCTKAGFANWDGISPATNLLAESIILPPDARVLQLGCGHGALGVALARAVPQGEVLLVDASHTATALATRTLAANGVANARVIGDPPAELPEAASFDVVVMEAPAGRKFARRWLALAGHALKPGGQLYVAGPKAEGIESIVADARALCGQSAILAYRDHNRVAMATLVAGHAPPDWASEPGIAPGTWAEASVNLAGMRTRIASLAGIFSYDRLDTGTAFLLANTQFRPGERILDAGCGWGALGIAAARAGATRVDLLDNSLLAVAAAGRNLADLGLTNARALPSDALTAVADERYDLIVTNPPFHTGRAVDYDAAGAFIAGARELLTPRGRLMLVANAFIRYERAMQETFGSVETVAENDRYHVLQSPTREPRRRDDGAPESDEELLLLGPRPAERAATGRGRHSGAGAR
jgi:16S rRNA (guanine1207-N2)-methyltransferase